MGHFPQSWNSRKSRILLQNVYSEASEHRCTSSSLGTAHFSLIMFIIIWTIMMMGKAQLLDWTELGSNSYSVSDSSVSLTSMNLCESQFPYL